LQKLHKCCGTEKEHSFKEDCVKRMSPSRLLLALFVFLSSVSIAFANPDSVKTEKGKDFTQPGIDEKLEQVIPEDIILTDEAGDTLNFKDLLSDKPIVLNLIYYTCPGICSPLVNGMIHTMESMDMTPGKDYQIITVSFDPTEGAKLAAEKKTAYYAQMERYALQPSDWRFLTGDSVQIKRLLDATGFITMKEGTEFAHPGALITLSPDGKICRYLYGVTFLPFDLKMALYEAGLGKSSPTIAKLLKLCYNYDPAGRSYVLNTTRLIGVVMLLVLLTFFIVVVFVLKKPKHKQEKSDTDQSHENDKTLPNIGDNNGK
jgi:protein SCO1/2